MTVYKKDVFNGYKWYRNYLCVDYHDKKSKKRTLSLGSADNLTFSRIAYAIVKVLAEANEKKLNDALGNGYMSFQEYLLIRVKEKTGIVFGDVPYLLRESFLSEYYS